MADSDRSTDGNNTAPGGTEAERSGTEAAQGETETDPQVVLAERQVILANRTGLHLRPARLFVETAGKFEAAIHVTCADQRVNGKSIMELLALAALPDSKLTIRAEGPDADRAVNALADLVEKGFSDNK